MKITTTVAAAAVGIGFLAGAAWLGSVWMEYGQNNEYPREALLKDKAIVWTSPKSFREFREELREYGPEQQEGLAASWITSERCMLLPAQRVKLIGIDGPMIMILTLEHEVWYTLPSQIESDEQEQDGEIEDRVKQMIEGR